MRTNARTIWFARLFVFALAFSLSRHARAQDVISATPITRASAAIVIDGNTGATLWAKNPDRRLPPASTTKIATGLLLARDVPPDQSVTTSAQAARTPGHALGMRAGETFRARDLLHAVMLASANDASVVAAEKMAHSEPTFAVRMTEWARQNGAANTRFANASGLPAPGHYSTARGLAAMARAALQNPAFAQAVRTRSYSLPRDGGRPPTPLTNENTLLGVVPGMDGVKAGWTREAGACFVGSATRNGQRIITVVLNSPDWQRETKALLDWGFAARKQQTSKPSPPTMQAADSPGAADARSGSTPPRPASRALAPSANVENRSPAPLTNAPGVKESRASRAPANESGANSAREGAASNAPTRNDASPAFGTPAQSAASIPAQTPAQTLNRPQSAPSFAPRAAQENRTPAPPGPVPTTPGAAAVSWPLPRSSGASTKMKGEPSMGANAGTPPAAHLSPPRYFDDTQAVSYRPQSEVSSPPPAKVSPVSAQRPPPPSHTSRPSLMQTATRTARLSWRMGLLGLLGLLALGLLRAWKGHWTMPDFFAGLRGRRRKSDPPPASDASGMLPAQARSVVPPVRPAFTFAAPLLDRQEGRVWLESILETPTRLLEPSARRIARGLRDADAHLCDAKIPGLLSAPNARLRLAGAELLGAYAPRLAEETLLTLLKDERVAGDVRAEAVQSLTELGGDRQEHLLLQMLLRDGSPPAAHALARLPGLEDASVQAMQATLAGGGEMREAEGELKRNLRSAHIACTLLAQGQLTRAEAAPCLNALPANHGEPILVTTLRGSSNPQAVECLVDIVLHGHAYPALQSLLETDPRLIRAALDLPGKPLDRAQQTRLAILKWLTLGEGNDAQMQELAGAGNDLARGAIQLHRLHHWEPGLIAPDALCAASQIYSLRLGFSGHAQGDIALAFRKAATDGEAQSLAALPPELRPLAQAYAHPDVYDAVQALMHTDDALPSLLAVLALQPENVAYRREMAFWSDKIAQAPRLTLTRALSADTTETPSAEDAATTRAALGARACDPDASVRNAALRWLRRHPEAAEQTEHAEEVLSTEDTDHTDKKQEIQGKGSQENRQTDAQQAA